MLKLCRHNLPGPNNRWYASVHSPSKAEQMRDQFHQDQDKTRGY